MNNATDTPYLLQGLKHVPTSSSVLVSSSRWLNSARMREWISTECLRRNGTDYPTTVGAFTCHLVLEELSDKKRIEDMLIEERRQNPVVDRWFKEGFRSTYKMNDLKSYPPGSLARTFYERLTACGLNPELIPWTEPKTHLEFWQLRNNQNHDLEHLIAGAHFDYIGEIVPYMYRTASVFKHLKNPELARDLTALHMLNGITLMTRTFLNYPECHQTLMAGAERGYRIAQLSGPIFTLKFEDAFHLPLPEARELLGVHGVEDVDTTPMSLLCDETQHKFVADPSKIPA